MTKRVGIAVVAAFAAIFAAAIVLSGCVSMEAPRTFNERLAYAYGSLAAARSTAAGMLERGRITRQQAQEAQTIADNARTLLDGSKATLDRGDIATAEGQLKLALDVLVALESKLKQLEAK